MTHFDIQTAEPRKAIDFYAGVFGWEFKKWEGPMEYWLIMTGSTEKDGIDGGLSKGEPLARAVNTLSIDDLDATVRKIEDAGGKVTQARNAIPGVGWFAAFEGPDGNQFGLMQEDREAR